MTNRSIERFNALARPWRLGTAILVSFLAGMAADAVGVPLGWLIGALAASAALAISGLSLGMSDAVRRVGQVVAGFSVGLFFTPEVGQRALELGWLMVLTSICSILASVFISVLLARIGGCDRRSAFFAMIPGGLAEMAGLAQQFGANMTLVSLSQSLRVITIVLTLPPLLVLLLGDTGAAIADRPEMGPLGVAAGLALAAAIALLLNRLGIFNPWLLGGLAAGIAFGMMAEAHLYAPGEARIFAQVAIGCALGARFQWEVLRTMSGRFLPATVASTLLLMVVNGLMAVAIVGWLDLSTGLLATAPGGIAEMSLTAEILHLAPPLVTAWQLVRIVLVALSTGPLFRLYQRWL